MWGSRILSVEVGGIRDETELTEHSSEGRREAFWSLRSPFHLLIMNYIYIYIRGRSSY